MTPFFLSIRDFSLYINTIFKKKLYKSSIYRTWRTVANVSRGANGPLEVKQLLSKYNVYWFIEYIYEPDKYSTKKSYISTIIHTYTT